MAASIAAKNRAVRREELRTYLAERGKLSYILDNVEKIEQLDQDLTQEEVNRLKVATDIRVKLLSKYLPDLKSVEMTGDDGKDLFPSKITIAYE